MAPSPRQRTVLDIGNWPLMQTYDIQEWTRRFRQYARRSPTEICLPAVGFTGPAYDSVVQPPPRSLGSADPLKAWVTSAREHAGPEGLVWAKIIGDFQFLDTEHLKLRSQYSQSYEQVCIINPITQQIVATFIKELAEHGVDGVVFDLSDHMPCSGLEGLMDGEVSMTCFCEHCIDRLREVGYRVDMSHFRGPEAPSKLLLKPTSTGTSHLDPSHGRIDGRDVLGLVEESRARSFIGPEGDWDKRAKIILDYCDARSRVVADAVRAITSQCVSLNLRSAVILSSVDYDMSQQVTLQALTRVDACGEYWVPDAPVSMTGEQVLCYLGGRSSYYLNSFCELVETANEYIAMRGVEKFLQRLLSFSKQWSNNNRLSPASVYAATLSPQYSGSVGVPLFEEEHLKLVGDLTQRVTGQMLPDAVQEQFRIAAGPSALAADEP